MRYSRRQKGGMKLEGREKVKRMREKRDEVLMETNRGNEIRRGMKRDKQNERKKE